jgi:deoxyuridine 5''-triphosphate nucleotidohydrolase (dut)
MFKTLSKEVPHPTRGTPGSAGHDVRALYDDTIPARGSVVVSTGVTADINSDYCVKVQSRSGMAFKHDIVAFHGLIDSDYFPKEIFVKLFNLGNVDYSFKKGDKIAQLVIQPVVIDKCCGVENNDRNDGFGSTGA